MLYTYLARSFQFASQSEQQKGLQYLLYQVRANPHCVLRRGCLDPPVFLLEMFHFDEKLENFYFVHDDFL